MIQKTNPKSALEYEATLRNSESADIESAFANVSDKNEIAEVLKELFDENKIYMISDLSKDEIKLATRIYMLADMKKIESWKIGLAFYVKFLISKDRKSRSEILRAIAGYQQPSGLLGKLGINKDRGF